MPEIMHLIPWGIITAVLVVGAFAAGWKLKAVETPSTADDRVIYPLAGGEREAEARRRFVHSVLEEIREEARRARPTRTWPISG